MPCASCLVLELEFEFYRRFHDCEMGRCLGWSDGFHNVIFHNLWWALGKRLNLTWAQRASTKPQTIPEDADGGCQNAYSKLRSASHLFSAQAAYAVGDNKKHYNVSPVWDVKSGGWMGECVVEGNDANVKATQYKVSILQEHVSRHACLRLFRRAVDPPPTQSS